MKIYFQVNEFYKNLEDCRISIHKEGYIQKGYHEEYNNKRLKEEFGYIELVSYNKDYMEVATVYVIDYMRGRGYGRRLYNRAVEHVKSKGCIGLISRDIWRNKKSNWIWQGTPFITIDGDKWNFMS
jgi:predicted GNAT family acetyltransferase